jgi:alanyl-tRNA synthetase
VPGNRKDNFWMMGDTGPCGPCSEIHIDLTPAGNGGARLVNAGSPQCIEIWNLVFIQFNSNPDGTLTPLPAKHVDTGMGFERVASMIQCTNGLKDFTRPISNYETDVFTPIFRELEKLSGKKYTSSLQDPGDIAFRVIADHIRCLSFAIADGIIPSNEGRGYVLRRILRRAVRYGRNLGFREPFFYKLVDVVVANFGQVFPELRTGQDNIKSKLKGEEESFNATLDRGIELFEGIVATGGVFPANDAFKLYDTFGFPLDLTELMARERGLTVDVAGFEKLMEEQRQRARQDHAKKKSVITVADDNLQVEPTKFLGYDNLEAEALVVAAALRAAEGDAPHRGAATPEFEIIVDKTTFYAEMGGQVGDTGLVHVPGHDRSEIGRLQVLDTQKQGDVHVHRCRLLPAPSGTGVSPVVSGETAGTAVPLLWRAPEIGEAVRVAVDAGRRANIQRHHTVTHLFHWALHQVVSKDARQRGSLVAPDRLRFDFNHPERLTEAQITDVERLVNERIKENTPVAWNELPYNEVKGNPKVMQFFGDKYGLIVRVVQIGGDIDRLDGFSMELCGGTHTKTTGEIGLFKITKESAISAGVRRVEAVCGQFAVDWLAEESGKRKAESEREQEREQQKAEGRKLKAESGKRASEIAGKLPTQGVVVENVGEGDAELLRAIIDAVKPKFTSGIVVLGALEGSGTAVPAVQPAATGETPVPLSKAKVYLLCYVTPDMVKTGKHAGKIVGELAKICGGGGGGKPDMAQAGGKAPEKLGEALAVVARLVG